MKTEDGRWKTDGGRQEMEDGRWRRSMKIKTENKTEYEDER